MEPVLIAAKRRRQMLQRGTKQVGPATNAIQSSRSTILWVVTILLVTAGSSNAFAQEKSTVWKEPSWSDPWEFRVNLYGWLPDAPATISVGDTTLVDAPESLGTILDSLNVTAMFELEAHKGPLAIFANSIYYDGTYDDNLTGVISGQERRYTLDEKVWAIRYGVGYTFGPWKLGEEANAPGMTLTPWAGAFYFHDDWDLRADPLDAVFDGFSTGGLVKFHTPMVGFTPRIQFNDRWYLNSSFSYGGWDTDGVDHIYDLLANAGYRFKMKGLDAKAFIGYRYLYFEWDDEDVGSTVKLRVRGPYIGIGWTF